MVVVCIVKAYMMASMHVRYSGVVLSMATCVVAYIIQACTVVD